jgi:hypothetical protein
MVCVISFAAFCRAPQDTEQRVVSVGNARRVSHNAKVVRPDG